MITINDKDLKKYERDLQTFADRAYPFATRHTVNSAAFKAQEISRGNVRNNLVTRNEFTEQSIRVDKARTLSVRRQAAVVGSTAEYMETQEFGGLKQSSSGKGVAIPTSYSAGQEGARPRTRLPRRANEITNILLQKRKKRGSTTKQQNFIAVRETAQSGRKYLYLDLGRSRGIFKVTGGKRKPKIKMVYDLTRPSVAIPRNPWLAPAVAETKKFIPNFYRDALKFQLQRQGLFR